MLLFFCSVLHYFLLIFFFSVCANSLWGSHEIFDILTFLFASRIKMYATFQLMPTTRVAVTPTTFGGRKMEFQNRVGSKTGGGGPAGWSESNRDRKERLKKLALETIDLTKVY